MLGLTTMVVGVLFFAPVLAEAPDGASPEAPGFTTLLPPLVAIVFALLTRQVLLSLFCGVWVGAALVFEANPFTSFLRALDHYVLGALADKDHGSILLFSLSLGGLVGILTASGAIRGVVEKLAERARSGRSGQTITAVLGCLIFFDDYANALIVGNTMRPLSDRLRTSREKLAFLVDATAAPIATLGIISTWTAYQLGLVAEVLPGLDFDPAPAPYLFFLGAIPFSFYSLLMILLVFSSAVSGRDFGPMHRAESRAQRTGDVLREGAQPLVGGELEELATQQAKPAHWALGVVPIVCVVLFTLIALYRTGVDRLQAVGEVEYRLRDVIAAADAFRSLLWASFGASIVAGVLALSRRMAISKVIEAWVSGARSLVLAAMTLLLAWSISAACNELRTGEYVLSITRGELPAHAIPALSFLAAGLIAFATGTSYGTMGILVPVLLPLSGSLAADAGLDASLRLTLCQATTAAILGGAVFGDHCSPISDTTVLSSMAAGSDHIDHVRTQLPYALLIAAVCLPSYWAIGLGVNALIVVPLAAVVVIAVFRGLSARTDESIDT